MRTALFYFIITGCVLADNATATTKIVCVSNTGELATALSSLANSPDNSDANEIRIRTGTYVAPAGGFTASVTSHHNLTIAGGYLDAACTQQTLDASLTILDGDHLSGVLNIGTIVTPVSDIEVSGLTFQNGSSSAFGYIAGGLKIGDPGPISGGKILVERNIFRDNSAAGSSQAVGGLLVATDGTPLIVRGNLFVGNTSPNAAAAYFYSDNAIDVSNNTFSGNQSTDSAQQVRVSVRFTTPTGIRLSNNIFWGNVFGAGQFDLKLSAELQGFAGATLTNNDIEATTGTAVSATGTLQVDPAFVGNGDFRLSAASPLINAGVNDPSGGLAGIDLDGSPRVDGIAVDLGAYESSYIFADGFD